MIKLSSPGIVQISQISATRYRKLCRSSKIGRIKVEVESIESTIIVISPKIIDDQRDTESFTEEGDSPSNLDSPSQNVTRKSTAENDSAVDKKSTTELFKESALVY